MKVRGSRKDVNVCGAYASQFGSQHWPRALVTCFFFTTAQASPCPHSCETDATTSQLRVALLVIRPTALAAPESMLLCSFPGSGCRRLTLATCP